MFPADAEPVRIRFAGAQAPGGLSGLERLSGSFYEFRAGGRRETPRFGRVRAAGVYPGIAVEAYVRNGLPEWDFVLEPGADAQAIRLRVDGAEAVLAQDGAVLAGPRLRIAAPATFYADGKREAIASRYRIEGREIAVELDAYDRARPVRIDPTLEFATFFGADFGEAGYDVALGPDGSIYMVGISRNLVAAPGSLAAVTGNSFDIFVMRVDPTGRELIYAATFGGAARDRGSSIAVGADGAAYVTGLAFSADFPVTAGAAQTTFGGGSRDAFVAKLSPDGSRLIYATYLGGRQFDDGNAVAVDAEGRAWVAGASASPDFPSTIDALQPASLSGEGSGFVARVSADGSTIEYASLLGGSGRDEVFALELDPSGPVWLAGRTSSADFPVAAEAFQPERAGSDDAFVLRLSEDGAEIEASTFLGGSICERALGGSFCDVANALAIEGDEIFVGGSTLGADFPVTSGVWQSTSGGGVAFGEGFVAVLDRDLTALRRSTFIGGRSEDEVNGIAVNDAGDVLIVGTSGSPDFVTTLDAVQPNYTRLDEGFLAVLSPNLDELLYSTFLGGEEGDRGFALAADATGLVVVSGETSSRDFPATVGVVQEALQSLRSEGGDAYVARFTIPPTPRLAPGGVLNAASFEEAPVAPGQLLTIFGRGLGPVEGAGARLDDTGRLARELAGVRVLFDGVPAALTYVGNSQINLVVPYAVAGLASTEMVVARNGGRSASTTLPVVPAAPAIFTVDGSGHGQAAVLNQDGTVNGPGNPAPRNSIITIFATGEGQTTPQGVDGRIAGDVLPRPVAPVIVGIGGEGAGIRYLGGAPGLTAGVLQINARISPDARTGPETELLMFVGGRRTQRGVTIAVE